MDLYEHLQAYAEQGKTPMHMPGHKRNASFFMKNPYEWDVTEVEGTDNLYHPREILSREMDRLRLHYGTKDSYLLVNGSTGGILAAIASCCRRGDRILVARNCHQSVYHAMFLLELTPVYLYPREDSQTGILLDISPERVAEVLEQEQKQGKKVSCVVLTSPTYEGIVSDIGGTADICHGKDIPLIVDEAHGAHFAWGQQFPRTAMQQGADLVIESLHKTLPSLTQTALLHRTSDRISGESLMHYLALFQTSSPSYVLMASISQCMSWLESQRDAVWTAYDKWLSDFEEQAGAWRYLQLWRGAGQERSKLVIGTWKTTLTGVQLAARLRDEYGIEVEMAAPHFILAMTSVADTRESLQRLARALTQIDDTLSAVRFCPEESGKTNAVAVGMPKAIVHMNAYKAFYQSGESLPVEECQGRISAEYASVYPPGIPFLVPGEEITAEVIEAFQQAGEYGLTLSGPADEEGRRIRVCQ